MDPDNGEDPDGGGVSSRINVDLINHITSSIIEMIFDWHEENNVCSINFSDMAIAISASATSAIEFLNRRPVNGETTQ